MIVMGRGNHVQNVAALPPGAMRLASSHDLSDYPGRGVGHIMSDEPIMERVLIVDDHPLVRDGLRSVIAISFDNIEIFEAATLDEAVATLEKQDNFDLILLDLNIPDVRRLDGLKLLRDRFPILPVVMVSGAFDRAIVQEALAAGAAGFIPKSLKRSAIVDALHRVVSGEIYLPEAMGESVAPTAEEDEISRRIDSLTPQQKTVLAHLVRGRLNKQIAHDLGVSMTTIKAHVSAILQKLGVLSRTQAVIKANQVHFRAD
ncbi:response regulator transcription factor (plasmid) [Sphingobium sp. SJ10-10]|uniref:response regulator n=1 Tax=unclassified Sphingobium TaxID=2611147 RepID=UPI00076FFB45|nr:MULTISPECIES: response regulator transcription factor [unclassified Sphingobium]AMK25947.1 putative response regulator [Sphingobium sp. TKS]MEC6701728.1 response regulator transcription factor [Sphingobium sp. SJ10-10]